MIRIIELWIEFMSILFTANLVVKDNQEWCMDVFDVFVTAGQSVTLGEAVIRRYRPVSADNNHIVLNIFSSERDDVKVKLFSFVFFLFYILNLLFL